jgi:hypothetical protein
MKNILLAGYVVGALLFSAFARAEQTDLSIQNINYQEGSWQISINGPLKNLCVTSPQAKLIPSDIEANTLILKMVGEQAEDICAQAIVKNYNVKADLRLLMQDSGVLISPHQIYRIKAEGNPFEAEVSGGDVMTLDHVRLTGILTSTSQGQMAVITDAQQIVLLDDSTVDSDTLMNQRVSITGRFAPQQSNDDSVVNPMRNQRILPIVPPQRLMVLKINPVAVR